MKRSAALQPLSRDHHQALSVALKMRRADDAQQAATDFLSFWEAHGRRHFQVEEEVLLPLWARLGTIDRDAAGRLAGEHLEIRARALALADDPDLGSVRELGEMLSEHVRFEERELFVAIESDLDADQLDRLAAAVAAAEDGPE